MDFESLKIWIGWEIETWKIGLFVGVFNLKLL
jgi:hypothetical protein